jgi:hypothetical protein
MSRRTDTQEDTEGRLLPFRTIEAATKGDVSAINKVLKHFEGYITALSLRRLFDEDGSVHVVVDNEIRRELETKLIVKIAQFDTTRTA